VVERLHVEHSGQLKITNRGSGSSVSRLHVKDVVLDYIERSVLQVSADTNWATTRPYRGNLDAVFENITVHHTGKSDNPSDFIGLFLYAEKGYTCKVTFINLVVEGRRIRSLRDLAESGNLPPDKAKIENVEVVFK
jgi:hypothetical protein